MHRAHAAAGILLGKMAKKEAVKEKETKKRNPLDDYLDQLDKYNEGTPAPEVEIDD